MRQTEDVMHLGKLLTLPPPKTPACLVTLESVTSVPPRPRPCKLCSSVRSSVPHQWGSDCV